MEEKKDTIEINGKTIAVIVILFLLLVSTFGMFALKKTNHASSTGTSTGVSTNGNYNNLPEKCRPPAGQDINAWKEHLSHHAETQDCLKYFN